MVHVDWLISGLEKVILPSQKIYLAISRNLSCLLKKFILPARVVHCTNEILKEIKAYYAVQ